MTRRRQFMKDVLAGSAALRMMPAAMAGQSGQSGPASSSLPKGEICKLRVSRLIQGGNQLAFATHSRDLRYVGNLVKHYYTDAKLRETLETAESQGIDTLAIHPDVHMMPLLKQHRAAGGKIKLILSTEPPAVPVDPGMEGYRRRIAELVDFGVDAIYLWGVRADKLVNDGQLDLMAKAFDLIKATKLPAGVGAHALKTVMASEKLQLPVDFYLKTFHHHDYPTAPKPGTAQDDNQEIPGYWCGKPQETLEFMATVRKPWIAFKVMAAGAIPPASAFKFAFENGADFIAAGMFDYEIADDVRIAKGVLSKIPNRKRPWQG
jgi:hypothetical protein